MQKILEGLLISVQLRFQDPARVNEKMLEIFSKNYQFRFELGSAHKSSRLSFGMKVLKQLKNFNQLDLKL